MKKKKNPLKRTRKISEPNLVLFNPWKLIQQMTVDLIAIFHRRL